MRTQDVVLGEYYRHADHPDYAYAKPIEKIPPKTGVNTKTYTIFKCEWMLSKNDIMGMIKYFRAENLVKEGMA